MPAPSKYWKAREREAAAFFGTRRTPLSGGNSGHGTRSDTLHPDIFVEVKVRKRSAIYSLYLATKALAKKENKVPILVIAQKNHPGFLIVVHSNDFPDFTNDHPVMTYLNDSGAWVSDPIPAKVVLSLSGETPCNTKNTQP